MVRFKNRYVVVEVNPLGQAAQEKFTGPMLHDAILDSIQKIHGDFGRGAIQAGCTTKYCNPITRVAVLRARHGPHRILASSLPFVSQINKQPATFHTLYIGATLKHCYLFLQKHQRAALDQMWASLTPKERPEMEKAVMDISALDTFVLKKEQHEADRGQSAT